MNLRTLRAIKNIIGPASRNTLPVLDYFHIDPEYLYCSNLSLTVRIRHNFPFADGSFPILIEKELFLKRMATIKAPFFISCLDMDNIIFQMPETSTKVRGMPFNDSFISTLPAVENQEKELFTLSYGELKMLNIARTFVAEDELRPVMQGVCISQDYFVASDAHKLYFRKLKSKKHTEDIIIYPSVVKLMMLSGDTFRISATKNRVICAESDDMKIWWKSVQDWNFLDMKITGTHYPQWRSVLPKENDNEIIVPVGEMLAALNSLAFAVNEASHMVKFSLKGKLLSLSGHDLDRDVESVEKIPIINKTGSEQEWGFKFEFIHGIFKVFQAEGRYQVSMKFKDPTRSFIFADYILIMPMMIC